MNRLLILCLVLLFAAGCTPSPRPIDYGHDACAYCKMTIVDPQHAAELVTRKGKAFKFDAIECMVNYAAANGEVSFSYVLVNDYLTPRKLIDAESATFLITEDIPSPMGAFLSAFPDRNSVETISKREDDKILDWDGLVSHMKAKKFVNHSSR